MNTQSKRLADRSPNSARTSDDELAQSLVDAFAEFTRQMRSVRLPTGMTRERLPVLALILEHGPIGVKDLAAIANVAPPTMSRMTTSLVNDGLVRKKGLKTDGRGILVSITAKGRRSLELANQRSVEHLKQTLAQLSSSQVEAWAGLAGVMQALNAEKEKGDL